LITIRRPSALPVAIASTLPGCQSSGFMVAISVKKVSRLAMSRNVPVVEARCRSA
jgi:hypothetical protein